MLEWTGERYLPNGDPALYGLEIHYEHLHRYAFASQFVKGKKVLDLASGEGYGTFILSQDALSVTGIEIDPAAVSHAKNTYHKENIEFREGSILSIPIGGEKLFDVIVCFEAIEHVREHDVLLSEIRRLLKDDGIVIISTPDKKQYSEEPVFQNPYHLNELYQVEFYELLKKFFPYVYLSGQQVFSGSSIYPLSSDETSSFSEFVVRFRGNRFYFTENEKKSPRYFIAFASNIELHPKEMQKSFLVDRSDTEIPLVQNKITVLSNQITDLRQHAGNLQAIVTDRESQIADLRQYTGNLQTIVADRESQIADLRQHTGNLQTIVASQNQQLQDVIRVNQLLSNENQSIKQSLTYNLTAKFHKKIVERLLPENTRRKKYYNLGLSGSRLLINEGWDRFWSRFRERNSTRSLSIDYSVPVPQTENETGEPDDTLVIPTKVSVIIPTKNAGPDFETVLEKIRNQKGIASVEIIIVDSGSTDGTCEVAEKFGCRNFSIKPEEFNHGRTRNYGAEKATGDFIVFLVQDAIPIGDYWLYHMIKILNTDDHIAALSCRQVPRSDADLFACYSMLYHYMAMEFFKDKIVHIEKDRFNQLPFSEKRKLAGLDDVCSCFRKDIFDQFKFENLNFAEDLGIGIRLIENGYKLAFLFSVGVIHSHNRDAEYFLRRYYIDSKSLAEMSEVTATPDNRDLNQAINSFKVVYLNMKNSLTRIKKYNPDDINVDHFFYTVKNDLYSLKEVSVKFPGETGLEKLLSAIFMLGYPGPVETEQFTREFSGILENFQKYVRNQSEGHNTNELIENTQKFFAIYFGSYMGNRYALHSKDTPMQSIDALLNKGV